MIDFAGRVGSSPAPDGSGSGVRARETGVDFGSEPVAPDVIAERWAEIAG